MNAAFLLVTLGLNNSVQPRTDPRAVQMVVDCFNYEFLLSHLAFTQTVSSLYAASQMFRLEVLHRGGFSGMRGCYLSKLYFSL